MDSGGGLTLAYKGVLLHVITDEYGVESIVEKMHDTSTLNSRF